MINGKLSGIIALIAILISLALHYPYLHHPPYGQHVWRQSSTMMVAENFYEEGMDIFHPRVNKRFDGDGITGMHFPLYEWVLAAFYQVWGKAFWLPRLWSWLLTVLGAWALFRISARWWNSRTAGILAFVFYLFSPELFFDGWIALPDVMALPLCLWGLDFYYRYRDHKRVWLLLISGLLFMLGGLVKLQYLGIGLLIAGELWRVRKQLSIPDWLAHGVFGLISVAPVLAWYWYARNLIERSGLADFGIEIKPAESLSQALRVLQKNLVSDIPETLLGFVSFTGLLITLVLFIRYRNKSGHPLFFPLLFFVAGFTAYHALEIRVLEHHQYYMLPYLAVLIPMAAKGMEFLSRGKPVWLSIICLAQVAACSLRMIPARFATEEIRIPEAFWFEKTRMQLQQAVPDTALIITGPDETMTVYLYFLHKKGWNYGRPGDLMDLEADGKPRIASALSRGCRYLITSETNLENSPAAPWLEEKIGYTHGFSIYTLRKPE